MTPQRVRGPAEIRPNLPSDLNIIRMSISVMAMVNAGPLGHLPPLEGARSAHCLPSLACFRCSWTTISTIDSTNESATACLPSHAFSKPSTSVRSHHPRSHRRFPTLPIDARPKASWVLPMPRCGGSVTPSTATLGHPCRGRTRGLSLPPIRRTSRDTAIRHPTCFE